MPDFLVAKLSDREGEYVEFSRMADHRTQAIGGTRGVQSGFVFVHDAADDEAAVAQVMETGGAGDYAAIQADHIAARLVTEAAHS
jgi:hypothetical protein